MAAQRMVAGRLTHELLAGQQHPELCRAFVGVGQAVCQSATDEIFHRDALAWARANADTELDDTLRPSGPPSYERSDILDYALEQPLRDLRSRAPLWEQPAAFLTLMNLVVEETSDAASTERCSPASGRSARAGVRSVRCRARWPVQWGACGPCTLLRRRAV